MRRAEAAFMPADRPFLREMLPQYSERGFPRMHEGTKGGSKCAEYNSAESQREFFAFCAASSFQPFMPAAVIIVLLGITTIRYRFEFFRVKGNEKVKVFMMLGSDKGECSMHFIACFACCSFTPFTVVAFCVH